MFISVDGKVIDMEDGNENSDEMSIEEMAAHANDKVDALIELLVKKKLITEKEFEKEFDSLFE